MKELRHRIFFITQIQPKAPVAATNQRPKQMNLRVFACSSLALGLHLTTLWLCLGWTLKPEPSQAAWGLQTPLLRNAGIAPAPYLFDSFVLAVGAEIRGTGGNPLDAKFIGSDGVVYNYPYAWTSLAFLNLNRSHTALIAWGLGLVFCAALLMLIPPFSPLSAACHGVVIISPPALNAIGQGNGELLVLALLMGASLLALKRGIKSQLLAASAISGASALKLYPAAALGALLVPRDFRRLIPFVTLVVVSAHFVAIREEIKIIVERTPKPFFQSFGCEVIPARAENLLKSGSSWSNPETVTGSLIHAVAEARPAFRTLFISLTALGFLLGWRSAEHYSLKYPDERAALMMSFGAILFLAAFGLGASWTHRALVLVFCLASCVVTGRSVPLIAMLIGMLWSPVITKGATFALEQFLMWTGVFILSRELGIIMRGADVIGRFSQTTWKSFSRME